MATARSARLPSAPGSAQEALYGELESMPSETQLPVAQPVLALSHA